MAKCPECGCLEYNTKEECPACGYMPRYTFEDDDDEFDEVSNTEETTESDEAFDVEPQTNNYSESTVDNSPEENPCSSGENSTPVPPEIQENPNEEPVDELVFDYNLDDLLKEEPEEEPKEEPEEKLIEEVKVKPQETPSKEENSFEEISTIVEDIDDHPIIEPDNEPEIEIEDNEEDNSSGVIKEYSDSPETYSNLSPLERDLMQTSGFDEEQLNKWFLAKEMYQDTPVRPEKERKNKTEFFITLKTIGVIVGSVLIHIFFIYYF